MFKQMMEKCCSASGEPDIEKMAAFMKEHDRSRGFEAVGWALFFIWVGIAWLLGFNLGVGLLGVGILIIAMQVSRYFADVAVERFWALVGFGFTLAGLWELWEIQVPLAPILLIAAGAGLLYWRIYHTRENS